MELNHSRKYLQSGLCTVTCRSLAAYYPLPPCLIRLVNWSSRSQSESDPLQSSPTIDSSKSNAETDPIWGSRLAPVQKDHWVGSLNECRLLALNLEASSYEDAKVDLMDAYHAHTFRFNFPHFISCLTLRDSYTQMYVRTDHNT